MACTDQLHVRGFSSSRNVAKIQSTPHLKRKLGQHLLINERILTQIVDAAELPALLAARQKEDENAVVRVLEIGPGTGNLTSALLNLSPRVHVHSVEYDERMVERLQERFGSEAERLSIEQTDFENFEFVTKEGDERVRHLDACVANIPYQLSSIIISRLTTYMHRYPERMQCAVLLVQEEFAQRLLAKPGSQNYSRLSVNTALVADVESVVKVGRNHFLPPPKVDSRVIKLTPRLTTEPLVGDDGEKLFFQRFDTLLRIVFLRKNKTLRAALLTSTATTLMEKSAQALSKEERTIRVEEALEASGLTTKRAVQLPVQDLLWYVYFQAS
ncbi:hypothetical protein Poli38472_013180 [Pythium oligandrum]|uniref:rRNA adenine N(6)-methyltransferase n=1 Tax=Pythium oligandrum TaxID=41045 RepID=A0A8K1FBY3_PYTOL|nr:hypothetical protein Poli38472_013180 [Pythium oligandrum]|eukprot:TMW55289.1 hypothetical protein Poli38472_013180 [Pythium oligandrum]